MTDGEPRITVLPDAAAAGRAAAERIADGLVEAVAARGRADWATTGGSTPVPVYEALATDPLKTRVPWGGVHVWWGDDRFVPRDHPLSNVEPLDQVLVGAAALAGLSGTGEDLVSVELGTVRAAPLPPAQIHAMPMGEAIGESRPASWVAERYEAQLRSAGLPLDRRGFPIFDVALVGLGSDGHVLSVFPGSTIFDGPAWVRAVPAPEHIEPHVARVSLNPAVLASARRLIVVALGSGKADIIATVLGAERDPARWPSQLARRPGAEWILDREAAARLPA